MKKEALLGIVGSIKKAAKTCLEGDKHARSMFFVLGDDGGHILDVDFCMGNENDSPEERTKKKIALRNNLVKFVREKKGIGFAHVIEAWVASVPPEEVSILLNDNTGRAEARAPRASQMPNRREVLMVTWECETEDSGRVNGTWSQFFRREGEEIVFEEDLSTDQPPHLSGIFGGILDEALHG